MSLPQLKVWGLLLRQQIGTVHLITIIEWIKQYKRYYSFYFFFFYSLPLSSLVVEIKLNATKKVEIILLNH